MKGKNPLDRSVEESIYTAIDKSGALGMVGDTANRIQKFTGLGKILGLDNSGYAGSNTGKYSAILGAQAGLLENYVKVLPGLLSGNPTSQEIIKLRKLMPGQNIFYLSWLMQMLDKKAERNFPKRRPKK